VNAQQQSKKRERLLVDTTDRGFDCAYTASSQADEGKQMLVVLAAGTGLCRHRRSSSSANLTTVSIRFRSRRPLPLRAEQILDRGGRAMASGEEREGWQRRFRFGGSWEASGRGLEEAEAAMAE
jgi:hypothetical protein